MTPRTKCTDGTADEAAQRKNQLTEKRSKERDISEAFKFYEQEVHPSGETLSLRRISCGV